MRATEIGGWRCINACVALGNIRSNSTFCTQPPKKTQYNSETLKYPVFHIIAPEKNVSSAEVRRTSSAVVECGLHKLS